MVNDGIFHIIGAGISGLTLALELVKKGKKIRIYESLNYVGGLARTERIDGFSFDCGPHLFHTANKSIQEYWEGILLDEIETPELYGANYVNNKLYEYPVSLESLKEQLTKEEYIQVQKEVGKNTNTSLAESSNYSEYVEGLAGKYLSELFFKKYPEKLWGIATKDLSAKFAPRRIEIRKRKRPFHSGKGKWAGVLKNGCGVLAEEIERKLQEKGVLIEYNKKLTDVDLSTVSAFSSISKIILNHEESIEISENDTVISTVPMTRLADMLGIKNKLWYRNVKIVALVLSEKITLPGGYDWLYFDDDQYIFHRVTLQDSFGSKSVPKGCSILTCEIAYDDKTSKDKAVYDSETLINTCVQQLISTSIVNKNVEIIKKHLIDAGPLYPGINVGYESELGRVRGKLDNINNLYIHGSLAEYEYSDLQVITAKSLDLAVLLSEDNSLHTENLVKKSRIYPSKSFNLCGKKIGGHEQCYVIAEIGLNHNGSVDLSKKMIDKAISSGVQAVKLQSYKKGRLSSKVRGARYYEELVDSQESTSNFLDKVSLNKDETREVFQYARDKGITIFSTPFDIESLAMLEELNCEAYKISSMDLVNIPLIKKVAQTKKPIIISTGMSELSDIQSAIDAVLSENNPNVVLLHCVSIYPCPAENANIEMINRLKSTFDCIVGYSDHTTGIDISIAAVAIGAKIIEKHYTFDKNMDGPDHNFSLVPSELSSLVKSIRRIELSLLDHGYGVLPSEIKTVQDLRRSIFFRVDMKEGEIITQNSIEIKSPGVGIHPKFLPLIVGRKVACSVESDYPVQWDLIK
ncbi:NAD(P)-binding protein [bacterium]|jgi:sialic acid synthase SpsE/protoporphyrinogen oxidase|nr:NAD(P)-binding protein [bacterium]